jgi:uncharacterized protein (DUF433 family)
MEVMNMVIQADPLPLRVDDQGAIRVGNSRVTLDVLVAEHKKGASPEAIAEEFDTLELADIYAALAYYLRHEDEVAAYLQRRETEAVAIRKKLEDAGVANPKIGEVLRARWAQEEKNAHASSHD